MALSTPLPVNTWTCLEFRLDHSAGCLETWVNGSLVTGLVVGGTPTQNVDRQWPAPGGWLPAPTDLRPSASGAWPAGHRRARRCRGAADRAGSADRPVPPGLARRGHAHGTGTGTGTG